MKKIITIIAFLSISCSYTANAQTFITPNSVNGDSSIVNGAGTLTVYNKIKATGSPVILRWSIVGYSSNLTVDGTEWGLDGVCDNVLCYTGAPLFALGSRFFTDKYTNASFGTFYALLNSDNALDGSLAWLKISAKDTSIGGTERILTFIGTKNATRIETMATLGDAINYFPNPAGNNLIVSLGNAAAKTIEVFGIDGRLFIALMVNDNVVSIDLSELNAGPYIAIIKNNNGQVLERRTFIHK